MSQSATSPRQEAKTEGVVHVGRSRSSEQIVTEHPVVSPTLSPPRRRGRPRKQDRFNAATSNAVEIVDSGKRRSARIAEKSRGCDKAVFQQSDKQHSTSAAVQVYEDPPTASNRDLRGTNLASMRQTNRRNNAKAAAAEARARQVAEKRQKQWCQLHEERRIAEGGFPSAAKLEHLKLPRSNPDIDDNGHPFYRVEVFPPRIGPLPSLVDKALEDSWSRLELEALLEGLQTYAGPDVYIRIFRKYCGPGRPLNRFNVTQIVVVAARLRDNLIEDDIFDAGPWLHDLFVWTKPPADEGQENEGDLLLEDDVGLDDIEVALD